MNYQTTINIDNTIKTIALKHALYMEAPIWEVVLDDISYIVRKSSQGWEQTSENSLSDDVLNEIGNAIEGLNLKEAG